MPDPFVLYNEKFRNGPNANGSCYTNGDIVATAATAEDAAALGATYAEHPEYTWVQYDLEADGVTLCTGVIRDDLPPHGA